MADDFAQGLVAAVDVFEFHVEHRIDPVFAQQGPKAVFPAITGENRAVVLRNLAVKIEFGCPPRGGTIFEFYIAAHKPVPVRRLSHRIEKFDFKISRLFHLMRVGDEVRPFLGLAPACENYRKEERGENSEWFHGLFLHVSSCNYVATTLAPLTLTAFALGVNRRSDFVLHPGCN